MSSLITIAITEIKCPDSLETMRIHLGFLVVGLGVVRAVGWEKTDDVVEVGLVRCVSILSAIYSGRSKEVIKKLTSTALCKMRISEGTLCLVVWLMDFSWAALLDKASMSSRRDCTN
jgi:hypothetical protein